MGTAEDENKIESFASNSSHLSITLKSRKQLKCILVMAMIGVDGVWKKLRCA